MRRDLARIDDTAAMPLIKPAGAGIRCIVDQAQAIEPQLVGTVVSVSEELLAKALIALQQILAGLCPLAPDLIHSTL